MSETVFVSVGQCGVGLGTNLVRLAAREAAAAEPGVGSSERARRRSYHFDDRDGKARIVLLDGDDRVFTDTKLVRDESCVASHSGAGRNWAVGYCDRAVLQERGEEAVRRELERCAERVTSITLMRSLDGGTGGGVGSALLESMRATYPKLFVVDVGVLGGYDPLSSYNACFSLQYSTALADCTILRTHAETARLLAKSKQRISTRDLEFSMARDIAAWFLPLTVGDDVLPHEAGRLIADLAPAGLTLLDLRCSMLPTSARVIGVRSDWAALATGLADSYPRADHYNKPLRCFAASAVARSFEGFDHLDFASLRRRLRSQDSFEPSTTRLSWRAMVDPLDQQHRRRTSERRQPFPTLAAMANTSLGPAEVEAQLGKAKKMLHARAYLHRFEEHGIEQDDFYAAFDDLKDIVSRYEDASFIPQ